MRGTSASDCYRRSVRSRSSVWLERLEQERGNIRAALEWARTSTEPEAAELGLRLAATLWLFWDVRGHMQEGREPLNDLLSLPSAQARTLAQAVLGTTLAAYTNDSERTVAVLQEALEIARPRGDTWSIGFALYNFGVLAMRGGRLDEAELFLEECRVLSAAS